jgi:beta-glucanase (GH16 family)
VSRSWNNSRTKAAVALTLSVVLATLLGGPTLATPSYTSTAPSGSKLAIRLGSPVVDNFTVLDSRRWYPYDSPTKQPRRSPDLVRVRSGELQLIGSVNAAGQEVGSGLGDRLGQKYGRWEARFRVDRGAGYGAVILLWPTTNTWPKDGEIDLIEIPKPERVHGINVVHNGPHNSSRAHGVAADFTQWHTVAVDWLPDRLVYWLDGKMTWTVDRSTRPYDGSTQNLVPSTAPMRFALQFDECAHAVYGSGWIPCRTAATPKQVIMHVDWVKVYPLLSAQLVPPAPQPSAPSGNAPPAEPIPATPRFTG